MRVFNKIISSHWLFLSGLLGVLVLSTGSVYGIQQIIQGKLHISATTHSDVAQSESGKTSSNGNKSSQSSTGNSSHRASGSSTPKTSTSTNGSTAATSSSSSGTNTANSTSTTSSPAPTPPAKVQLTLANLKSANFTGTLLGAHADPNDTWVNAADAEQKVVNYEALTNHKVVIDQHFYDWTDSWPTSLEPWDVAGGRVPMVSWASSAPTLASIISGSQDSIITSHAHAAAAFGSPLFVRPLAEMNGNWTPWDGSHNGQNTADYITAWRHIYTLFQAAGATNVIFVWSPNADDVPNVAWNHWTNYYPGDAYVDWIGIDGYNWGTTQPGSVWQSFKSIMSPIYNDYASKKPIMISETGSAEVGGDKAAWITSMQSDIKSSLPKIKAVVWFDVNKETDWRVDSSANALNAYKAITSDSYFNP